MRDLDVEIRRRLEEKSRRTEEFSTRSSADRELNELLILLSASRELELQGISAHIEGGKVTLKKAGKPYGEWLIRDAWFEYRTLNCAEEQIYRAAWTEQAIALTSSIVTGMHGGTQLSSSRSEQSRLIFSVKQERGVPLSVAVKLLDGQFPSLGTGQLSFTLADRTSIESACRIVRNLNRDLLALSILRRSACSQYRV